jgi:hypothetical protein
MTAFLAWLALALLTITSAGIILSRNWRWTLALLAILYVGVFISVRFYWPPGMAAVKLITGWMATTILGMTQLGIASHPEPVEETLPQGFPFRLLMTALIGVAVTAAAPSLSGLIPGIGLVESAASLLLIGLGLLYLGITSQPLQATIGLLVALAGFEILYAAVEGSILVAGLLAVVNLGLALTGAYILLAGESRQNA